jgi:hypothetical protein
LKNYWQGDSIEEALSKWHKDKDTKAFKALPLTLAWGIWLARNAKL